MDEVPLLQRPLLTLDDKRAVAAQHEKALLRVLAVVYGHRLAGLEDEQVHTELRERQDSVPLGLVVRLEVPREGQERASPLAMKPPRLACVDDEPLVARGDDPSLGLLERSLRNHGSSIERIRPEPPPHRGSGLSCRHSLEENPQSRLGRAAAPRQR